jgi:GxxExxY protein
MKEINNLTRQIIGAAFTVHSLLGAGLLENAYKECLYYELVNKGLFVEKEKGLPLLYKKVKLDIGYRLDLFVEQSVIIEIKSVECFSDVHIAQVLTYLKLTKSKVGLLINFNVADLKKGIKRLIL